MKKKWRIELRSALLAGLRFVAGGKYDPVLKDNAYKIHMKLTINSVSPADYGSYKCVSRNSLGDTDGSIKVYRKYNYGVSSLKFFSALSLLHSQPALMILVIESLSSRTNTTRFRRINCSKIALFAVVQDTSRRVPGFNEVAPWFAVACTDCSLLSSSCVKIVGIFYRSRATEIRREAGQTLYS